MKRFGQPLFVTPEGVTATESIKEVARPRRRLDRAAALAGWADLSAAGCGLLLIEEAIGNGEHIHQQVLFARELSARVNRRPTLRSL